MKHANEVRSTAVLSRDNVLFHTYVNILHTSFEMTNNSMGSREMTVDWRRVS